MKLASQKAELSCRLHYDNNIYLNFEANEEGSYIKASLPTNTEITWSDRKNAKRGNQSNLVQHLIDHSISQAPVTVLSGFMYPNTNNRWVQGLVLDKIDLTFD